MRINFKELPYEKPIYINDDPPEEITNPIEPIRPIAPSIPEKEYKTKYSYFFGLDSIEFTKQSINENMCFISKDINIGFLKENEYIEISSIYNEGYDGSIEFYIIDGSDIKPILPVETDKVYNEKVFNGLKPRFIIDELEEVIIKENGYIVDKSIEQAINNIDGKYTITYMPIDPYSIKTNNENIKIKVIIRSYNLNQQLPYIKNITIRKYGGHN